MVYTVISDSIGTISQFARKERIKLSHSGVLTDYQKKLTIPWRYLMQTNFDDIRFVTDSGTHIPYWIESKTDSSTADVWVKNDYVDGDTYIWMYYGNSGLSSGSSITDTFIDGSEFDDLTGWTQQAGSWSVVSGILHSPTTSNASYLRRTVPISEASYIITTRAMTTNNIRFITMVEANNPMSNSVSLAGQVSTGNNEFDLRRNWSWSPTAGTFNDDTFYITEIDVVAGNNVMRVYDGNHNYLSVTPTRSDGTGTGGYFGFYTYTNDNEYDWIHVRKYTAVEPTYSIGAEEHQRRTPQFIN